MLGAIRNERARSARVEEVTVTLLVKYRIRSSRKESIVS
jgi:hypothetical protein